MARPCNSFKTIVKGACSAGAPLFKTVAPLISPYIKSADFKDITRTRLMHGSDWKMLLLEKHSDEYLGRFSRLISEISSRDDKLKSDFFGMNPASFLGLRQGNATRNRLEQFYQKRICLHLYGWAKSTLNSNHSQNSCAWALSTYDNRFFERNPIPRWEN